MILSLGVCGYLDRPAVSLLTSKLRQMALVVQGLLLALYLPWSMVHGPWQSIDLTAWLLLRILVDVVRSG